MDIETLVFEALGEVSMCWFPPPGNQIFDSTKAKEIGDRLVAALKSAQVAEPIAPELSDAQIVAIHRLFYPMDTPDFKYVIACHREAIAADRRLK